MNESSDGLARQGNDRSDKDGIFGSPMKPILNRKKVHKDFQNILKKEEWGEKQKGFWRDNKLK